jgi:hypothetical protein
MANFRTLSIIVPVVVFCVSFAFMMRERKHQDQPASVLDAPQSSPVEARATATAALPQLPAPPPQLPPPAAALRRVTASPPPTKVTPSEDPPDPPLPISVHIRNLRNLNRIEGEVRNNSSAPLSVTLQDLNPNTQNTTELQLDIAPGETKTYSTDDGLVMAARDQLILHSPRFKDHVVRVP